MALKTTQVRKSTNNATDPGVLDPPRRSMTEITESFVDEYGVAVSVLDARMMKLELKVDNLMDLLTREGIGGKKLTSFGKSVRRRYLHQKD